MIPHSRPTLDAEDAARVAAVVRGGFLAQGPEAAAFEREMARYLGVEDAAAVASGSAALELALRALGVGAGDEVVIPTYTCDALHHAVVRCGATPILADADPVTAALAVTDVARRLTARTRAIIAVHAFGLATDLAPLCALGVPVVEDCAQALGARTAGRRAGALGALAVCSFYATKLLTTGEGGLVAGPAALVARARDGRDYDEREDLAPRFNHKLTDMQAALGRSQLARFDGFLARRRSLAARYRAALAGVACELPPDAGEAHVYHRFVVGVRRPVDEVLAALASRGIAARRPVYRPLHRARGESGFPVAERLWATQVSLPCYPLLADADAERVADALRRVLAA
ncbi:MAG: DegT/DnrJ/EryC1/StrS aminotransferase family protein [Candidatus Rokubacteria bacterium]|nr:DegT/DnrJ/EryC1/StrS aminotransferase family protein [Candidatus Rokubacteria bacterium]